MEATQLLDVGDVSDEKEDVAPSDCAVVVSSWGDRQRKILVGGKLEASALLFLIKTRSLLATGWTAGRRRAGSGPGISSFASWYACAVVHTVLTLPIRHLVPGYRFGQAKRARLVLNARLGLVMVSTGVNVIGRQSTARHRDQERLNRWKEDYRDQAVNGGLGVRTLSGP